MEQLKSIELAEIGLLKVNAKNGQNVFTSAHEAIYLSKLLNVAVELYWNGKKHLILQHATVSEVVGNLLGDGPEKK